MRNIMRFGCAGVAICLGVWYCQANGKRPKVQTASSRQPFVSQWSTPSEQGLQTRLVPVTRVARQGKPLFIRMEVRHKDAKQWAQATGVVGYPAEVLVKDRQGKVVDTLSVRLRFRTKVPAGEGISIGVFPAGQKSAALDTGTYLVYVKPRTSQELLGRGAVQLPIAGPLQFEIPPTPHSAPAKISLKPDYEQAEELKIYLQANPGYPMQLVDQGLSIVPGLVALVEKGEANVADNYPSLPLWQYAAFLIGDIGDKRAVPFLLKRLNDPGSMDFYFVRPLGKLGVKQAVSKLINELRTLDNHEWEVMSSAYGSKAIYLVKALERITGQKFPHARPTDRDATLKAVNAWWGKQDRKPYETPATEPETQPASATPEK